MEREITRLATLLAPLLRVSLLNPETWKSLLHVQEPSEPSRTQRLPCRLLQSDSGPARDLIQQTNGEGEQRRYGNCRVTVLQVAIDLGPKQ